jgi:hypothetical protein
MNGPSTVASADDPPAAKRARGGTTALENLSDLFTDLRALGFNRGGSILITKIIPVRPSLKVCAIRTTYWKAEIVVTHNRPSPPPKIRG